MMKIVVNDIDYPKELFNFHKDLPFLPEKKR